MHSMNTDFIVPLETKLDAEEKTLMVALCIKLYDKPLMQFPGYAQDLQTGEWEERIGK